MTPGYTTTFTLCATNSAGSVNANTTVTVVPLAAIYSPTVYNEPDTGINIVKTSSSSLLATGLGDDNQWGNSGVLLAVLIGLLAVAAAVIVILSRKPALAYGGRRPGTEAGYLHSATTPGDATEFPKTSPVGELGSARLIADGGQISISKRDGALGREDFRSLVVPSKANLISREHVRLNYENGEYYIEDQNSTNGTKINGSRISGRDRFSLKDGDKIVLADVLTLIFRT